MPKLTRSVLDDDRVGRLLLKLSLPAFVGMFVITLYNVIDTIFVGRYVGPLGIAGLTIVFPVQMLSMGIGHMTGIGGASLISRLLEPGDKNKSEHVLGNAITATIILSLILAVTGLVAPDFWLRLMGASDTILPFARDYLIIILWGIIFQTFSMTLNFLVRAEGNVVVPMLGMVMGAVLNIILDAIFIIPLGMGVSGAALATLIAQVISASFMLSYYFTGKSFLKLNVRDLVLKLNILQGIFAIGIAAFAMTLTVSFSAALTNVLMSKYGGDIAVSAYGIINRVVMFAIMPGIVIGQGLQPILGFNYGAKRYDRALRVIKIAMISAMIFSTIAFVCLYFFPEIFVGIFTIEPELITSSAYGAKRIFAAIFLVGFMQVGSLIFQSIGKALKSFFSSISRTALFLIPMLFILPRFMELEGLWLAFPLADVFSFLLIMILLIPQILELRRLRKAGKTSSD